MKKFFNFLYIFIGAVATSTAMEVPLTPRTAQIHQLQEQVGNLQGVVVALLQERTGNQTRVNELEQDMITLLQERKNRLEMANQLAQLQAQQNTTHEQLRRGAFYIFYTSQGLVSRYYIQLWINRYAEKIKPGYPKVASVLQGTSTEIATLAAGAGTYATQLVVDKSEFNMPEGFTVFKRRLNDGACQVIDGFKRFQEIMGEVLLCHPPLNCPEELAVKNGSVQVEMEPDHNKIVFIKIMGFCASVTGASIATGWLSAKYHWRIVKHL